jgi:uncharacterized small protein (DUF1192 family)
MSSRAGPQEQGIRGRSGRRRPAAVAPQSVGTIPPAGDVMASATARTRVRRADAAGCDNHGGRGYFQGQRTEVEMPAIDDEDRPKKKIAHEIGQDLTLLSVGELGERIGLLKEEIARLEANISSKRASLSAADTFFKK